MLARCRSIHLTNDAVQTQFDHYGEHEDHNKLSLAELQAALAAEGATLDVLAGLWPQMRAAVRQLFSATRDRLNIGAVAYCFELMGADFMVGADNQARVAPPPCSVTLLARARGHSTRATKGAAGARRRASAHFSARSGHARRACRAPGRCYKPGLVCVQRPCVAAQASERPQVYLIEVNTCPALQLHGRVLADLLPRVVEETFQKAIDPYFPAPPGAAPPSAALDGFERIELDPAPSTLRAADRLAVAVATRPVAAAPAAGGARVQPCSRDQTAVVCSRRARTYRQPHKHRHERDTGRQDGSEWACNWVRTLLVRHVAVLQAAAAY